MNRQVISQEIDGFFKWLLSVYYINTLLLMDELEMVTILLRLCYVMCWRGKG